MQWWINANSVRTTNDNTPEPCAIGVNNGLIEHRLSMSQWHSLAPKGEVNDLEYRLVTPGLIDCHTHLVYAGHRSAEFIQRLNGHDYRDIAQAGGGILATVKATRAASLDELVAASTPRLKAMMAEGVTTIEIKSGYGLDLDTELKMLKAARLLAQHHPIRIKTTLLAAHAIPEDYQGRSDDYIRWACEELIPAVAEAKLADAVDVFCETIAFSPKQCQKLFHTAQAHGLAIKGHMEQLSLSGGAAMAAHCKALSVDHLEYLDQAGVEAIAHSSTVATLLPGAYYFLGESQPPPVALLRQHHVPIAIGSDLNPGSCPIASLRLMLNMACTLFGLTPTEALNGVTCHGAKALGEGHRLGQLKPGYVADFAVWDLEDSAQLSYQFNPQDLYLRVFGGQAT